MLRIRLIVICIRFFRFAARVYFFVGTRFFCFPENFFFLLPVPLFFLPSSESFHQHIYQRFINPGASEKQVILFQRVMIVLLAIVAYLVSSFFVSILDMALYAYTMVGAAVTPALLAALLWKRVTPAGGVISIAAGVFVTLLFGVLNSIGYTNWDYDYIIYPAGGASIFCLIVVSLLTPPSPESKWRQFME